MNPRKIMPMIPVAVLLFVIWGLALSYQTPPTTNRHRMSLFAGGFGKAPVDKKKTPSPEIVPETEGKTTAKLKRRATAGATVAKKETTDTTLFALRAAEKRVPSPTHGDAIRFVTKKGTGACVTANHCPSFNMLYPGIRAVHSDPPIFEIDNFFSKEMCESYIERSSTGSEIACQPLAGSLKIKSYTVCLLSVCCLLSICVST